MDGAVVGRRRTGQVDGMVAGSQPLTQSGDSSAAKTTRMGDSDSFCLRDDDEVQEV